MRAQPRSFARIASFLACAACVAACDNGPATDAAKLAPSFDTTGDAAQGLSVDDVATSGAAAASSSTPSCDAVRSACNIERRVARQVARDLQERCEDTCARGNRACRGACLASKTAALTAASEAYATCLATDCVDGERCEAQARITFQGCAAAARDAANACVKGCGKSKICVAACNATKATAQAECKATELATRANVCESGEACVKGCKTTEQACSSSARDGENDGRTRCSDDDRVGEEPCERSIDACLIAQSACAAECIGSACIPKTAATACASEQNCGTAPDGCGGTVSCGSCASPLTCGTNGVCVNLCAGVTCSGDQCNTAGTCDPATGVCAAPTPLSGTTCDDNNACTRGETCQAGACGSGTACDANATCGAAGCSCAAQYAGDGFSCAHLPVDCQLSAFGPFSACSSACGPGTQTAARTVLTEPAYGGAACGPLTQDQACNNGPCESFSWVAGGYGACSVICGDGTQTRTVVCTGSLQGPVADAFCTDEKPTTSQDCTGNTCCPAGTVASGDVCVLCEAGTYSSVVAATSCTPCPAGFRSTAARTSCVEIDECADGTDNCCAAATCANTPGSFTCTCNAGYTGDGVTCAPIVGPTAGAMTVLTTPSTVRPTAQSGVNIQARDAAGRNRTSGGDPFSVVIRTGTASTSLSVRDNGDGTYSASYAAPPLPGPFQVDVKLNGVKVASATVTVIAATCSPVVVPGVAPAGAHLDDFGGRVIAAPRVVQVIWGQGSFDSHVTSSGTPSVASFYRALLSDGNYLGWLSREYGTSAAGTFAGAFTIQPTRTEQTLEDSAVRAELSAQIAAGALPAPTVDAAGNPTTYYAVYFPHGFSIDNGGTPTCQPGGFCSYHGAVAGLLNTPEFYYGVYPDMQAGSGCDTLCNVAATPFGNLTAQASAALTSAITDPEGSFVGIPAGAPGWMDPINGDISDLCAGHSETFTASDGQIYSEALAFSNAAGQCVLPSTCASDTPVATASTTTAAGDALTHAWQYYFASFTVFVADQNGHPMTTGGAAIDAHLSYSAVRVPANVIDNGDGTYTVKYLVPVHTYHATVDVTLGGTPIAGSPWNVDVGGSTYGPLSVITNDLSDPTGIVNTFTFSMVDAGGAPVLDFHDRFRAFSTNGYPLIPLAFSQAAPGLGNFTFAGQFVGNCETSVQVVNDVSALDLAGSPFLIQFI